MQARRCTGDATTKAPEWVQAPRQRVALPAPLKLPAQAIDDDGQITLGNGRAAMVAATSVNLGLRTADEQQALIDTYGRWLNSLNTPTQIVVSAQPVDLASHARTLAARARHQPHPARLCPALHPTPIRRKTILQIKLRVFQGYVMSRTGTGEVPETAAPVELVPLPQPAALKAYSL